MESSVVFGMTVSGRAASFTGIESMTGPTIATVPFRIIFSQEETVRGALTNVQTRYATMIPFEQIGLQNIRTLSDNAAAACEFQSYIIIQPPSEDLGQSLMESSPIFWTDYKMFSSYSLVLFLSPSSNNRGYNIRVNFDPVVIGENEVQRLLQQFEYVFRQLSDKFNQKIQDIQMCSPEDLRQLEIWNPPLHVPRENCLHDLVLKHCTTQPNALAVSSWVGAPISTLCSIFLAPSLHTKPL